MPSRTWVRCRSRSLGSWPGDSYRWSHSPNGTGYRSTVNGAAAAGSVRIHEPRPPGGPGFPLGVKLGRPGAGPGGAVPLPGGLFLAGRLQHPWATAWPWSLTMVTQNRLCGLRAAASASPRTSSGSRAPRPQASPGRSASRSWVASSNVRLTSAGSAGSPGRGLPSPPPAPPCGPPSGRRRDRCRELGHPGLQAQHHLGRPSPAPHRSPGLPGPHRRPAQPRRLTPPAGPARPASG